MPTSEVRILVVDDDPAILTLLKRIFQLEFGDAIKVQYCDNSNQALAMCHTENIDILVTDLNMPNSNGFNLLTLLKAKNPLAQVVVLSAQPITNAIRSAFQLGVSDYLIKPVERELLVSSVAFLIARVRRFRRHVENVEAVV